MCGIIGLFAKDSSFESQLGELFEPMLVAMAERGPDSAGIALYSHGAAETEYKYSLYESDEAFDWQKFENAIVGDIQSKSFKQVAKCGVLISPVGISELQRWLAQHYPTVKVMGRGSEMEIYKDVGSPSDIAERYRIRDIKASCMIGHTRMATESAVNVEGSHPYTSGDDLCIVHNGSYANHNSIRRVVAGDGILCDSWNDTEVAARYVQWRLEKGHDLKQALQEMLNDFSGFFTLAIGLKGQFAVMRDSFACKPMVVAETDSYVACASEFRALAHLPDVDQANIFEPEPERIYTWSR